MGTDFDILVFGASGFTGRLAAIYLCQSYPQLRIAIAGRDFTKLSQVAAQCKGAPEILIADVKQAHTVQAIVKRSSVVANFAGPFSLYGEPLVAACAQHGRHYCDITGETPWVRSMIHHYQTLALQSGACLVPFAGFDSVPADLLSFLALREAEKYGYHLDSLTHYYKLRGGFNGGTLASALTLAESGHKHELFDPNILVPDATWPNNQQPNEKATYEPVLERWTAPFFMNSINTAVVRRSAFLRLKGAEPSSHLFHYEERIILGKGLMGKARAVTTGKAIGAFNTLSHTSFGRKIIRALGPEPGEGPSEKTRQRAFYRGRLIGRSQDVPKILASIDTQGDPSNELTITFACEIAKLLSEGPQHNIPKGFSTPSVAFGSLLIDRLKEAGIGFHVAQI